MGNSSLSVRIERLRDNLYEVKHSLPFDSTDCTLIGDLLRLLYPPCDNPDFWFWKSVAESVEDPRKVSFAYREEDVLNDYKRRFCSMAKFLKGRARQHGATFTDEESDRIAFLVGSYYPKPEEWKFEVLTGHDLSEAYEESPYWGSCMSGKRYFDMLAANPEKVALVKIKRADEWVGRALLWTTSEGTRFLDRVYPSDTGSQCQAAWDWATAQGYDYRENQCCGDVESHSGRNDYEVALKVGRAETFPYLDTFKYTNDNPREESRITLRMDSGDYSFTETDGTFEGDDSGCRCHSCDDRVSEEESYTNDDGYTYCSECYHERHVYLEYKHEGRRVDGEYLRSDCSDCHHCGEIRYEDHMIDVEGDMYCSECADDHVGSCDECEERFRFDSLNECDGGSYCAECLKDVSTECKECGERHLLDNMEEVDSLGTGLVTGQQSYACSECMVPCRHCGSDRPLSSECRSCAAKTQLVLIAV